MYKLQLIDINTKKLIVDEEEHHNLGKINHLLEQCLSENDIIMSTLGDDDPSIYLDYVVHMIVNFNGDTIYKVYFETELVNEYTY